MAKYVQQPDITLPNAGSNTLLHFVKTFENTDKDALDIDVNLWLLSLTTIPSSPIIRETHFSVHLSAPPMPVITYFTQIHYILVE